MNVSIKSTSCKDMEDIAHYVPLRVLLISFLTIAVLAIPMIIIVIRRIVKNGLYHRNTKVVLVAHSIALILHHADRLVFHGSDLYRYVITLPISNSACDIVSTSERCFGLRLTFNCAMWFAIYTTPALVLERYLATRRTSTYQKDRTSYIWILVFQFVLSAILLCLVYAKQSFGGTTLYCMAASSSLPFHVLLALSLTVLIQLVSILFYRHLVDKNEKLRISLQKSGGDLIRKYQIEETLRALRVLYQPVHLMFLVQFTYSVTTFFVLYFNFHFSRPLYFFLMEATILIPEYSLAFVVTFIRMENRISKTKESLKKLKENYEVNTKQYFQNYKLAWA